MHKGMSRFDCCSLSSLPVFNKAGLDLGCVVAVYGTRNGKGK